MAAIITRRKWTRQPGYPREPAWNNPLLRNARQLYCAPFDHNLIDGAANAAAAVPIQDAVSGLGWELNGASAYLDGVVPVAEVNAANPWTQACLVSFSSVATDSAISIIAASAGGGTRDRSVYLDASAKISAYVYPGSSVIISSATAAVAGKSYAVVASCSAGLFSLFVDGILAASASVAGSGYAGYSTTHLILGYGDAISATAGSTANISNFLRADGYAWGLAEAEAFRDNPWQLFAPRTRRLYFGAAAGGNTVLTPGVGALTLTGKNPSVVFGGGQTFTPGKGALILTSYAPNVVTKQILVPGVGSLTLTGKAPTVKTQQVLKPGVGSIVLTGYAPSVLAGGSQILHPGLGSILLSGFSPTIVQSGTGTNATSVQVLEDGPRYTILKFTFLLSASDLAETLVVDPAAQYVDPMGTPTTKYSIIGAAWSVPPTVTLRLQWKATTNVDALTCVGSDSVPDFGPLQNDAGAGVNGQLVAITKGYSSGTVVGSVVLSLLKGN